MNIGTFLKAAFFAEQSNICIFVFIFAYIFVYFVYIFFLCIFVVELSYAYILHSSPFFSLRSLYNILLDL